MELVRVVGRERIRLALRYDGDEADHENRVRRIEQRDDQVGDEQLGDQCLGRAREVPIERNQTARRLRLRRHFGGSEGFFEQAEHGSSMHVSTVLDQTVAASFRELFDHLVGGGEQRR